MIGCHATIRRLDPADASALIALRLEVAAVNESAMGASLAEEQARSIQSFKDQLAPEGPSALFGGFVDSQLVAAAGIYRPSTLPSSAHKAALWGVVVSPTRRRTGLGRVVIEMAIAHSFSVGVRRVNLTVYLPNEAAVRLYESMGFRTYGTEPQALCIDGHFYDAQLMSKECNGG